MVSECCVCHASFDVVCDVSEYGMWYVRVCEFVCVCLHCQMLCSCLMLVVVVVVCHDQVRC